MVLSHDFSIIFLFVVFLYFWFFKTEVPFLKSLISDNQMLVFTSILYAYLTYKNIQTSMNVFKYQRMPYITINNFEEAESYSIKYRLKNESNFPAKNIKIYFEILYPVPEKKLKTSAPLFIRRSLNNLLYSICPHTKKPQYISLISIKWMEPNSFTEVSIDDEIQKSIPMSKCGKNNDCMNKEVYFDVIVSWEFISVDNLFVENKFYKLFKYQRNSSGIKFVIDSDKPTKIY
jgi:hypothetical protein